MAIASRVTPPPSIVGLAGGASADVALHSVTGRSSSRTRDCAAVRWNTFGEGHDTDEGLSLTTTQLIVFGLLVAAFVSGWVARGPGSGGPGDPTAPEDGADAPVAVEEDPGALLRRMSAVHEAVINAWLDGLEPEEPLARFDIELDRLRRVAAESPVSPRLRDALAAFEESARVFARYRDGQRLTAATSKHLEAIEDRIAQALPDA